MFAAPSWLASAERILQIQGLAIYQSLDVASYVLLDANYNPVQLRASIVGNTWNVFDPNTGPLVFLGSSADFDP